MDTITTTQAAPLPFSPIPDRAELDRRQHDAEYNAAMYLSVYADFAEEGNDSAAASALASAVRHARDVEAYRAAWLQRYDAEQAQRLAVA